MRPSDNLFLLIKSLTKSEKREFKLLAQRYKNSTNRLAIRLYEIIDKLPEFDETKIIEKLNISNAATVYPPMKVYLHHLIMRILRNGISETSTHMIIIQLIQDIYIYEERGMNSLLVKTIKKAITLASDREEHHLIAMLIELDCRFKLDQNINIGKEFLSDTENLENKIFKAQMTEMRFRHLFYRLWLQYKLYRKSKSKNFNEQVSLIRNEISAYHLDEIEGFKAQWYYLRINSVLANIDDDKSAGLRYCRQMVNLFDHHPGHKNDNFPSYRSALVNFLVASHRLRQYEDFPATLKRLAEIECNSEREKALLFSDSTFYEILYLMNSKQFDKIIQIIPNVEANIIRYKQLLPESRVLTFYNNIAIACFLCLDYENAHNYVNKVFNYGTELRTDILRSAAMLELLIHFEIGNPTIVIYKSRNLIRELKSRNETTKLEQLTSKYLKRIRGSANRGDTHRIFQEFQETIEQLHAINPNNPPVFCDELILWLQSKNK